MAKKNNRLLVPEAKEALERMEMEIANEFGINLGADTASRLNGSVGGEMVKRLISMAQEHLSSSYTNSNTKS